MVSSQVSCLNWYRPAAEDCATCHRPHVSENRKLLAEAPADADGGTGYVRGIAQRIGPPASTVIRLRPLRLEP